jgi:hypothetical protein
MQKVTLQNLGRLAEDAHLETKRSYEGDASIVLNAFNKAVKLDSSGDIPRGGSKNCIRPFSLHVFQCLVYLWHPNIHCVS